MKTLSEAIKYIREHEVARESRPTFHLTGPVGWINDPNGFSSYQGLVHLFYQYHPYSLEWGPMHWGHAVSEDMVLWRDLPPALAPDQPYDEGGCFSGSAIETEEGHILFYTGVEKNKDGQYLQNQCAAIGNGRDYTKVSANPIIRGEDLPTGFNQIDFRDPKVWKDGEEYSLIAGNLDSKGNGQVVLFTSQDLTHWSFKNVLASNVDYQIGTMWECPDFFPLDGQHVLIFSPQNMMAKGLEYHNGHNSVYILGDYKKEEGQFTGNQPYSLDYGLDYYAPQTTQLPDGRRILVAWLKSWDSHIVPEGQSWHGMMTLPRELSIKEGKIYQRPIRELAHYWQNPIIYKDLVLEKEALELDGINGRIIDLSIHLSDIACQEIRIDLAKNAQYQTSLIIQKEKGYIEIDRTYSGLTKDVVTQRKMPLPEGDSLEIRLILDQSSLEMFINDGQMVASSVLPTPLEADSIAFSCDGSLKMDIEKYDVVVNKEKNIKRTKTLEN